MRRIGRVLTLVVCVLFIVAGAVNEGFSSFWCALPFLAIFIYALKIFSIKVKVTALVALALLITPLAWDHPENTLIYPWIGDEFVAECGWKATTPVEKYATEQYELLLSEAFDNGKEFIGSQREIPCGVPWVLTRVEVSHPEFGTVFNPIFSIDGQAFKMPGYVLDEAFKAHRIKHRHINRSLELQSRWTMYLSTLMVWPALPIMLFTYLMSM